MKYFSASFIAMIGLFSVSDMADAQTYSADTVSLGSVYQARRYGNSIYDSTENKTFITYNSTNMDIYVRAYNHGTQAWEAAVKIASLGQSDENAYHDYSVIQLLPNGRLAVFYANHTVATYMLTAPAAHSASGTWTKRTISTDRTTYPMPIVVGNTVYFLYARNSNISWPYRPLRMIKSNDNGVTWTSPDPIVDSKMTDDKFNEVYNYGIQYYDRKIYFTYTMCGGPSGHNRQCQNLYMNYIDTSNDQVYSVTGENLGSQVDQADLDRSLVTLAPSSSPNAPEASTTIWQPMPRVNSAGQPVVGFGYYVGDTQAIRFGRLVDGHWTFQDIVTGTRGFNDMALAADGGFDILHSTGGKLISIHRTPSGVLSTNYSLAFNAEGTTANTWRASLVAGRNSVDAIGTSYNGTTSKSDYSGKWPVFAIIRQ